MSFWSLLQQFPKIGTLTSSAATIFLQQASPFGDAYIDLPEEFRMPFRARLKRAFGGGDSADDYDPSNPLTHGSSKKAKKNLPDNVYKPGEAMPRPKYRGPWNQAHQDKLSAFSFGDSWSRRKSSTPPIKPKRRNSEYSPMGSKLPSRGPSRRSSNWSTFSMKAGKRPWGTGSRQQSRQNVHDAARQQSVKEVNEGEDDVMNGMWSLSYNNSDCSTCWPFHD